MTKRKSMTFKSGFWEKLETLAAPRKMTPLDYLYFLVEKEFQDFLESNRIK